MKRFELTSETKVIFGHALHRIRALISFGDVAGGELGGWVEKEANLCQYGSAWVYGNAMVSDNALVSGNAMVSGDAWVSDNARVYGNAWVYGNARVSGDARVYGDAWVSDNARVYGDAWVSGNARVSGDARVYGQGSIFWIGAVGSRNGTTTFFACKDKKIRVSCGCFFGDLDEFAAKVNTTHGDNQHAKVYMLAIEMAKARIDLDAIPDDEEESHEP